MLEKGKITIKEWDLLVYMEKQHLTEMEEECEFCIGNDFV